MKDPAEVAWRRWTGAEDREVRRALDGTPGGIGRLGRGELRELADRLRGRSYSAVASRVREERERRNGGQRVSGSANPDLVCTIPNCQRLRLARGWCSTHYAHWRRRGCPEAPRLSARPWTRRELAKVRELLDETPGGIGKVRMGSATDLAGAIGRSPDAVRGKILLLRRRRRLRMSRRELLAASWQDARHRKSR